MTELIKTLRTTLASNFTLFLKAQMFHWNIEGKNFPQYHDFFADVYTDLYEQNDKLAEYIRIQDEYAPGSLKVYSEISLVKDEDIFPRERAMFETLSSDNKIMIDLYQKLFDEAEAIKDHGLSDYASTRLDAHKKLAWMLRSILKD